MAFVNIEDHFLDSFVEQQIELLVPMINGGYNITNNVAALFLKFLNPIQLARSGKEKQLQQVRLKKQMQRLTTTKLMIRDGVWSKKLLQRQLLPKHRPLIRDRV